MSAIQDQDKFVFRLPDGMRDELKSAAQNNGRSMNAEIVARLSGMDSAGLRDRFAGQALSGLLSNPGGPVQASDLKGWSFTNCGPAVVAHVCWEIADAMLAARSARQEQGR